MAELGTREIEAAVNFAAYDDAAADTGAESDADTALRTLRGPGQRLAQRGGVGVVLNVYVEAQPVMHHLAQGDVFKTQVVGIFHDAGFLVAGAGAADADVCNFLHSDASVSRRLPGHAGHVVDDGLRRPGQRRFAFGRADDMAAAVHDTRLDIGSAEIDADCIHEKDLPVSSMYGAGPRVGCFSEG